MKKLSIIFIITLLLSGYYKDTKIIDSNCKCFLEFNDDWEEYTTTDKYVTDDGLTLDRDPRIMGETETCLAMWNKEKKMLLTVFKFSDEETMKQSDDEILKTIRENLELQNTFLGYKFLKQAEYSFFEKDLYAFIAERSVNGDYQIDLIAIDENQCNIIEISGNDTRDIFKELEILDNYNK